MVERVIADFSKLSSLKESKNNSMAKMLKTIAKPPQALRNRSTVKDVHCFRTGPVRTLCEGSIYE